MLCFHGDIQDGVLVPLFKVIGKYTIFQQFDFFHFDLKFGHYSLTC